MPIISLKESLVFEWDQHNTLHIARHYVTPREAEQVFFDSKVVLFEDTKHSLKEARFIILGKTKAERLLYQVFMRRGGKIRVISSRDINRKEVKLYEKET